MVQDLKKPGENLVGQTILEKWKIVELIDLKSKDSTGGYFCIPYFVENLETGDRAFLKVMNVVKAIQTYKDKNIGVIESLANITSNHSFELELLKICNEKGFKRIVQALGAGEVKVDVEPLGEIGFPFLIFELGDGDTYTYLKDTKNLDHVWWLSTLHQACLGIRDLHSIDASHQDLKPSNLVFFGMDKVKLADLGRSARKGTPSRNDEKIGDATYSPLEYLYGYTPTNWNERYLSIDLYLLGSLAICGYSGISLTWAILSKLEPSYKPQNYKGQYHEILPVIIKAFAEVLVEIKKDVPEEFQDLFITTIEQLCHPDPALRGHPINRIMKFGNQYSLERYISNFNRMFVIAKRNLHK